MRIWNVSFTTAYGQNSSVNVEAKTARGAITEALRVHKGRGGLRAIASVTLRAET